MEFNGVTHCGRRHRRKSEPPKSDRPQCSPGDASTVISEVDTKLTTDWRSLSARKAAADGVAIEGMTGRAHTARTRNVALKLVSFRDNRSVASRAGFERIVTPFALETAECERFAVLALALFLFTAARARRLDAASGLHKPNNDRLRGMPHASGSFSNPLPHTVRDSRLRDVVGDSRAQLE